MQMSYAESNGQVGLQGFQRKPIDLCYVFEEPLKKESQCNLGRGSYWKPLRATIHLCCY
jgi:hypothetical protein